jgi:hypothetical protein
LDLFTWIENTAVGTWVRESPWGFPGSLVVHVWSMAFVGGISLLLALGVFGPARPLLQPLLPRYLPLTWTAFAVSLLSGLVLMATYPEQVLSNTLFYFKMCCIAVALSLAGSLQRRCAALPLPYAAPFPPALKVRAALILLAWFSAIVTGRLLYYTY